MTNLVIIAITFLGLPLAAEMARAQEPTKKKTGQMQSTAVDSKQAALLAQMKRVQDSFDKTNDNMFFQMAFVASITEIRRLQATDHLYGRLADGEKDVVVLKVKAIAKPDAQAMKKVESFVIPVSQIPGIRALFGGRIFDMLFEYNRIGQREFVYKHGC